MLEKGAERLPVEELVKRVKGWQVNVLGVDYTIRGMSQGYVEVEDCETGEVDHLCPIHVEDVLRRAKKQKRA